MYTDTEKGTRTKNRLKFALLLQTTSPDKHYKYKQTKPVHKYRPCIHNITSNTSRYAIATLNQYSTQTVMFNILT